MTDNEARQDRELGELKVAFTTFKDAMPVAYVPRLEHQARWAEQDKLLTKMDQKLDQIIAKNDNVFPQLATTATRIQGLENENKDLHSEIQIVREEIKSLRIWIYGLLGGILITIIASVVVQLLFH